MKKTKYKNVILYAQISINTLTELKIGPKIALGILPQNVLLRRLDTVKVVPINRFNSVGGGGGGGGSAL